MKSDERNYGFIMRNGQLEKVWKLTIENNFFDTYLYCRGTESEVMEYMESELGYKPAHIALTDDAIRNIGSLHCKIYVAPEIPIWK